MANLREEILTLEEVAVYLKAGKRTVYRLVQQGDIPAFKLGGRGDFVVTNWIVGLQPVLQKPQSNRSVNAVYLYPQ